VNQRSAPTSIGWGFERQPFRDAAAAISRATHNIRAGQAFFAQGVHRLKHLLPGLPMCPAKLVAPRRFGPPLMQSSIVMIVLDVPVG
jgi:hypothetical protein